MYYRVASTECLLSTTALYLLLQSISFASAAPYSVVAPGYYLKGVPGPPLYEDASIGQYVLNEINVDKLNSAMKALMDLNDGELKALLSGESIQKIASRISPPTALFVSAASNHFQTLRRILPENYQKRQDEDMIETLPSDVFIARRHKLSDKKTGVKVEFLNDDNLGRGTNTEGSNTDSLLNALIKLSEYLKTNRRDLSRSDKGSTLVASTDSPQTRRNNTLFDEARSRGRRSHRRHRLPVDIWDVKNFHDEFFYRPEKCPSAHDGTTRLFCPTPNEDGQSWKCVDPEELCDNIPQCPNSEDEHPSSCLFFIPVKEQLNQVIDIMAGIARDLKHKENHRPFIQRLLKTPWLKL